MLEKETNTLYLNYTCSCSVATNMHKFVWQTEITVYGVITEPGHHTTVVSLYGGERSPFLWTVVTVNFSDIFLRLCGDDDYYDWMPWNIVSEIDCTVYVRIYRCIYITVALAVLCK